jgi:hypothetical protein
MLNFCAVGHARPSGALPSSYRRVTVHGWSMIGGFRPLREGVSLRTLEAPAPPRVLGAGPAIVRSQDFNWRGGGPYRRLDRWHSHLPSWYRAHRQPRYGFWSSTGKPMRYQPSRCISARVSRAKSLTGWYPARCLPYRPTLALARLDGRASRNLGGPRRSPR